MAADSHSHPVLAAPRHPALRTRARYRRLHRLPLSHALQAFASPQQARDWALGAGDDYELLLAVPPRGYGELASLAAKLDLRLTPVGELRRGTGVSWASHGAKFTPQAHGYDHFR